MKFSIIVPIYNVEKYLRPCLDSLTGQTYENLEILLIENGSTDAGPSICREYAQNDERIRIFVMENNGPGGARNLGLQEATGEYVLFVDGDDFIEKNTCSILAKVLEERNYPDILMADAVYALPDGTTKPKRNAAVWCEKEDGPSFWVENQKRRAMPSSLVVHICKNSFLQRNTFRFPEGRYHEDTYWTFQIYLKAGRVSFLEYPFYYHVMRPGSTTHSVNPKRCRDIIWVADELKKCCARESNGYEMYYREYICYLYATALHSAVLQNLPAGKVFSKEEKRQLAGELKKSRQKKYRLTAFFLQWGLWGLYAFFYRKSRRKKQC